MAYQYDDPAAMAAAAAQQKQQGWDRFRSTARAGQAQRQGLYDKAEAKREAYEKDLAAENKRKSSNWLNWTALGTGLGTMFGMPWLGAGLGTLAGMGKAAASGGDIFDFRSQMKYLDPRMVSGAVTGLANMPSKTDAIKTAAEQVGVPGMPTASGRRFDVDDPTMGTKFESTWGMSQAEQDALSRRLHLRQDLISEGRQNLIDQLLSKKNGGQ